MKINIFVESKGKKARIRAKSFKEAHLRLKTFEKYVPQEIRKIKKKILK